MNPRKIESAHDLFLDKEFELSCSEEYELEFDADERENELALAAGDRKIVRGEPNRLLLDLDTVEQQEQFKRMLPQFRRRWPIEDVSEWESGGGNKHVSIRIGLEFPVVDRIALQLILGSDPMRELMSLIRHYDGVEEPSVLFQPRKKVPSAT